MRGLLSLIVALAALGCGTTFFEATCNDRPRGFVSRATMTLDWRREIMFACSDPVS